MPKICLWKMFPTVFLTFSTFFKMNFYWSIVSLQCCVSFYYRKMNQLCIHVCPHLWTPPHPGLHRALSRVPCAVQRFSLVICFIHSINGAYIFQSQSPHSSTLPPPTITEKTLLIIQVLRSYLQMVFENCNSAIYSKNIALSELSIHILNTEWLIKCAISLCFGLCHTFGICFTFLFHVLQSVFLYS